MTTCCETYGHCRQGDTCPLRTGIVLPHQAEYAARVTHHPGGQRTCDQLGVCQGRGDCDCAGDYADTVPPQAGSFQIVDLGPDDEADDYNHTMALVRTLLGWLLAVMLAVGALALGVSYATEAHAEVLWQLLQGVA